MRRIICFIACAFGKDDIDNLYENAISVALDNLKIKQLRIDKVNHNENIDLKIIELIKKADFGIADLTYARPSVYFEAGYLEGQKKTVVFLGRKDHFSPKSDDEFGNFKIHFDLITRNIITWDKPNSTLIKLISDRLTLIVNPIEKKIVAENETQILKNDFNSLSINNRIKKLSDTSLDFIKNNLTSIDIKLNNTTYIILVAKILGKYFNIIFLIKETFTKREIREYHPVGIAWANYLSRYIKDFSLDKLVIFVSLRTISGSSVDSALNWCDKIDDKHYKYSDQFFTFRYFVLDKIELTQQLTGKLNDIFNGLKNSS
jgi:nucleoside 2-deoxyribosyltransferase